MRVNYSFGEMAKVVSKKELCRRFVALHFGFCLTPQETAYMEYDDGDGLTSLWFSQDGRWEELTPMENAELWFQAERTRQGQFYTMSWYQ